MSTTTQAVVTSQRIEDLLRAGESATVEFKARLPDPKTVARLFVAFANTQGGTLIVGVDGEGTPIGLSDEEAVHAHKRLRELASAVLPSETVSGIVDLGGRTVVYLDVAKAAPNVAPFATAEGEFFVRRGSKTEKSGGEQLVREAKAKSETPSVTKSQARRTSALRRQNRRLRLFVAMSFAFEEEPALVDYFEAIRRAVARLRRRIDIRRVDLERGDYEISQAVMDIIAESDIVLADFTRSPQNVYFEAGFARGCGKPVIQTARTGTSLHFDVRTWRTTFFRNATELEEKLVGELNAIVDGIRSVVRGRPKAKRGRPRAA